MSEEERPTLTLREVIAETERDMETKNKQSESSITPAKTSTHHPAKRIKL